MGPSVSIALSDFTQTRSNIMQSVKLALESCARIDVEQLLHREDNDRCIQVVPVERSECVLQAHTMHEVSDDDVEDKSPPPISYPLQEQLNDLTVPGHSLERISHSDAALDGIRTAQEAIQTDKIACTQQTTNKDFFRGQDK